MNLSDPENVRFVVYVHTSPKGKRYVGITSQPVKVRWGYQGHEYKDNSHFWNAIQKYGWDNFKHEIIAEDLTLEKASIMECDLISKYNTMNSEYGYNHTTGGNWSRPSPEIRKKLSIRIRESRADPEVRKKLSESLKGHPVSEETKKKISEALLGKKYPKKRRIFTIEERIAISQRMKGKAPWCKGLTKETDARILQISEKLKGRTYSEETLHRMKNSQKAVRERKGKTLWINNGEFETLISESERTSSIYAGFSVGRLQDKTIYIYKDEVSKKCSPEDLNSYLSQGWKLGRPQKTLDNIKSRIQKYYWMYEGKRFENAKELSEYLNDHGYPKIVSSTITALYLKGFDSSPTYSSLSGKIERCEVNSEN